MDVEAIAGWWLGAITIESEDIPGDKCLDVVARFQGNETDRQLIKTRGDTSILLHFVDGLNASLYTDVHQGLWTQ